MSVLMRLHEFSSLKIILGGFFIPLFRTHVFVSSWDISHFR